MFHPQRHACLSFYKIYVPLPPQALWALCDIHSISDILPLPPHTVNPPGSQSHWSFSHLPIMQASWRWNGNRRKESTRYELCPSLRWNWQIWGEIMCCASVLKLSSSHLAALTSHHTLLASEPLLSVCQKSLEKGCFKLQKLFSSVSVSNNAQKRSFILFEGCALCGLSVQISPWRMRRKQLAIWEAKPAVVGLLWDPGNHTHRIPDEVTETYTQSWCLPPLQPEKLLLLHMSLHVSFETISVKLVSLPDLKGLLNTAYTLMVWPTIH